MAKKKEKIRVVYYKDESDLFCPFCDGRTNGVGGYDESPGEKYEYRKCVDCYKTFKLILSW